MMSLFLLSRAAIRILRTLLADSPEVKEELIQEGIEKGQQQGQLKTARAALRKVLARRGLALRAALERWLDQAVTAATAEDALA